MKTLLHYDNGDISNIEKTPEGFLRLTGTIAAVGWLTYLNQDGSTRKEYVSEETLFDPDHLDSIGGAPLTYLHKGGFVTPKNYQENVVGATGTRVIANVPKKIIDIVVLVQEEEAIEAVESGNATGLSMGYTVKVVQNEDGTYRQTERRCNHNSLVDQGRCPEAKLHLDGWYQKKEEKTIILPQKEEKKRNNLIIYHSKFNFY